MKDYQIFPKKIFLQAMGKLDASGLMVQNSVSKIWLNVFWIGFSIPSCGPLAGS